jgi:hypothetical protein
VPSGYRAICDVASELEDGFASSDKDLERISETDIKKYLMNDLKGGKIDYLHLAQAGRYSKKNSFKRWWKLSDKWFVLMIVIGLAMLIGFSLGVSTVYTTIVFGVMLFGIALSSGLALSIGSTYRSKFLIFIFWVIVPVLIVMSIIAASP